MSKSKKEQLNYLDNLKDEDIVYDFDSPETDEAFWTDAEVVHRAKKKKLEEPVR